MDHMYESGLDLAYETGWLRGRIDGVINHLEKDYGGAITLQSKIDIAITSLRATVNGDGLAESIQRHREWRKLSSDAPKN